MPVVTLASFVVIAKDTFPGDDISQRIFEHMRRTTYRLRHPPNAHFNKSIWRKLMTLTHKQIGFHVGIYTNTNEVLSISPTMTLP